MTRDQLGVKSHHLAIIAKRLILFILHLECAQFPPIYHSADEALAQAPELGLGYSDLLGQVL